MKADRNTIQIQKENNMPEKGTEFLSVYIQMLIKYSGGYGFESLRSI